MTQPVPFPPIYELAPEASQLMDVLVDVGHLDERLLNRVNQALSQLSKPLDQDGVGILGLADVRRIAATAIFEGLGDLEGEARRTIEREWGVLFY
jgi:hypothetical protein